MNYRSDIQILRGIAVLLVVLFHLGFSSLKSGFLGVDVFFVISGFLMAVLYDEDNKSGFYLRRARRLLPPYYVVILFTLIASFLFTTMNEASQVINQTIYATAFASNIGFWMEASYFSKSHFNPLLHLWSLGVEIQFYIIVPIIFWLLKKSKINYFLIMSMSFILCLVVVGISPKTSFFMMPLRLWEFLIGYGAAYYFTNNGSLKFYKYNWLGLFGLTFLLMIPFISVDGDALSALYGHPGILALLVSLATASVLVFGLPSIVEKFMISKLLERLGKYSYSIYLIHFPVIVIYLSEPFSGTKLGADSFVDGLIISVLIIIASMLLYYFIESRKFKYSVRKLVIIPSIVLMGVILVLLFAQNIYIPKGEQLIFEASTDRSTYRCGKLIRVIEPRAISCDLTSEINSPNQKIMLVGNSHADSIKEALRETSIEHQTKVFFIVQNTPLMKNGITPEKIIEDAVSKKIDKLILHFKSHSISNEVLQNFIELAKFEGIKVYFIEPVPMWKHHIPSGMYSLMVNNEDKIGVMTKADYLEENLEQIKYIREIDDENFTSLPIVDLFCKPTCEYSTNKGVPLYFDTDHLTITGSKRINDVFEVILKN
ncbi:acyltransferase family protein [Pseudoalteromonas sp. bablab_jr011]|uniref:acyltransferase family protein n=1 Tax=Pseudoalteromonas sp. bablab_jr011 TaxID=2755062 RepID=UPI0018F54BE9|nr:acyltransferase family protein [Pseudoalteromonas sp. bablab_jr011]